MSLTDWEEADNRDTCMSVFGSKNDGILFYWEAGASRSGGGGGHPQRPAG